MGYELWVMSYGIKIYTHISYLITHISKSACFYFIHNRWIHERTDITQILHFTFSNFAQYATHYFSASCFW